MYTYQMYITYIAYLCLDAHACVCLCVKFADKYRHIPKF